ncbi:MAG: translocation/assembly module TamB domain-containing protein [Phycisphaerales bacterium]|nr:translocation/assembly module TamB domain-containing protein [Hyphomonadaceae bacterium]
MSAPEEPEAPAPKAKRRRRWWAYAAGGVLVAGGSFVAVGPAAPWVVDHLADGQRVWRLGRIQVDGVSGGWLGNLRAAHISIEDEEGVWLEASDVALDWRPQDILFGAMRIQTGRAASINVLRQPRLLERRPPSGATIDVFIGDLQIDEITLQEAVFGQAATFTGALALDIESESLEALAVELRRTDSDADRLIVAYRPHEDFELNLDALSAPGGIFARALGVPEQGLRATAVGEGDAQTGSATYQALVGDAPLLEGEARWSAEQWSLNAQAQIDALPRLATIARRIGPSAAINAEGARVGAFTAHAETPFLALDLSGELNEERELVGATRFIATTDQLSDIARESPFALGAARLEGELRRTNGTTAIRGTLDAQQIDALGQSVRMTGPVEAALTAERFSLTGDLQAPDNAPPLFANARLRTSFEYDRRRARFELGRSELSGDAIAMTAQGWVNGDSGEFSGEWRLRQLSALASDLTGEAGGRYRATAQQSEDGRIWIAAVEGAGARIDGAPAIVPQLLGAAPRLDGRFIYEDGGITVSHARVDGDNLRAGVTGRIVSGNANLALEASARGPLDIGGARIDGALDATGQITGRIARPTITARATLSSFAAGGVVIEQPVVDFTLAPQGRGYSGQADVTGAVSGQPLTASSDIGIAGGVITLTQLDAQVAALTAQGSASISARGVSAELDVNGAIDGLAPGATGRLVGKVSLTPDVLRLDAQIMDARAGELRVRAATLHAEGPMDRIAARFDMRGRLRDAPLAFEGAGAVSFARGGADIRMEGRGTLADVAVFTRTPMTARIQSGTIDANLDVALGDGVVRAQWQDRGRALSGSAQIEDAPLTPLAAIWGERADGRIDGTITLANAGGGLRGAADIRLEDARIAGRQRGRLHMHIVGDLEPSRLRATVEATSTDGLTARFEADAPVVTSAAPIRIALAPERRGRATWSVSGPADSLWAAARLQDQQLSGQLEGQGELAFGAGYLAGDGYIEIVDGRFEDKLTGVTLIDLDARVAIDQRGVTIENFSASGPRGGRLTATGGSANPREGRIAVNVDEMRIVDRPDARAVASGELTLAWEGLVSQLSGQLNIVEAEIDIAANPEAGIPTIEVIEINRPGYEDEPEEAEPPRSNAGTTLDVRVRAPGRVFTRGRGVDAEWSLNLRLAGSASDPQIFGTARAIRGTISLSGQPFEIDDATISFDGDPLDAEIILTATRDTPDLTAYLRLSGTARDPEISFTSDPGLPEDEILPQVLFGRSVEDLSALEAAQLAGSLAALSGQASLDLVDAARAAAGLDRLNVRQDESGGFLVAGGVYLTRNVYLEVARTGLGETQTQVEYTIRPRLVLITSFLGNGDQRVSLRWRRESD